MMRIECNYVESTSMDAITLTVEIPENRQVLITLPPDTPSGVAQITIMPQADIPAVGQPLTREEARRRLLAAGALNINHYAPEGTVMLSEDELIQLGQLAP